MITLPRDSRRFCDGISRRGFLSIGGLFLGGLNGLGLPQLLQAEQRSGQGRGHKAVISILLAGGLSHLDTFDLKPDAPPEVRGEFKPIQTSVPGIHIGELLPRTARLMEKLVLIRSITGMSDEHSSFQNLTGYRQGESERDGRPNFASIVARVQGPTDPKVPAFMDLFPEMKFKPYNCPGPGKLGRAYAGVKVNSEDLDNMKLNFVAPDRLSERQRLLAEMDRFQRVAETATALDAHYAQAFDILTTSKVVEALDLERESRPLRDRYGQGSPEVPAGGGPLWNEQLLRARRLVEAGARCVTVAYGGWDTHKHNFTQLRKDLPLFDQGITALVQDIQDRGLANDVLIVVWGEFGRTPKINTDAGRDHWAPVNGCILAGGDIRAGQVIGATDKQGAAVTSRPVQYLDVFATIYRHLGIDPHGMVTDVTGRPAPILPDYARPIRELF